MQQDKFRQAHDLLQGESQPAASTSNNSSIIEEPSPKDVRKGSGSYYRFKYTQLRQKVDEFIKETNEVDLDVIPGFYEKNKVKSSKQNKEKSVRITQMSGSMTAKKACEAVKKLRGKECRQLKTKKENVKRSFNAKKNVVAKHVNAKQVDSNSAVFARMS